MVGTSNESDPEIAIELDAVWSTVKNTPAGKNDQFGNCTDQLTGGIFLFSTNDFLLALKAIKSCHGNILGNLTKLYSCGNKTIS